MTRDERDNILEHLFWGMLKTFIKIGDIEQIEHYATLLEQLHNKTGEFAPCNVHGED